MHLGIRTKLLLGFAVVLLPASMLHVYGLTGMSLLAGQTTQIHDHHLRVTRAVLSADVELFKMQRDMRHLALCRNAAEIEATVSRVNDEEQEAFKQLDVVGEWIVGDEGKRLADETREVFRNWKPIRDEVIGLMRAEERERGLAIILTKGAQQVAHVDSQMQRLKNYVANRATELYLNAGATKSNIMTVALVGLGVVVVISGLFIFFFSNNIAGPVEAVAEIARGLAVGDVDQRIDIERGDELGVMAVAFQNMMAYQQEMADAARRLAMGDLSAEAVPKSSRDVLGNAFNQMIANLRRLVKQAEAVSEGDLNTQVVVRSDEDQLAKAIERMTATLRQVSQQAAVIATGDFSVDFVPRGDKDELGIALQRMLHTLRDVTEVCQAVTRGDYDRSVTVKGERDLLGQAINHMVVTLREVTAENTKRLWMSTGQAELNDRMRGQQDLPALANNIVCFLCDYLNAQVGALYVGDGNDAMNLMSSYAYTRRKNLSNRFEFGEGLLGQAALEKKTIVIDHVPDDYMCITSGLGEKKPSSILVLPFMYENCVHGIVELGSLTEFADDQIDLLESAAENIAVAFNTAQARDRMRELLDQTRQQAEELRQQTAELEAQQEELRQVNEDLEQQTKALRESEERLKAQQEELELTNEELEEKTRTLEDQQAAINKQNQELQSAQKELERKAGELAATSKYKSEFLANMSHELRTPLNSLLILARMLSDNESANLSEGEVESAKIIYNSGTELLSLINEILDLAKVEAGKMDRHPEWVNLRELTAAIDKSCAHVAEEKGLSLTVELKEDLPEGMETDRKRLDQILMNLISNAFKFTEEGGVTVTFHRPGKETKFSRSDLELNRTIAVSVTDTGIGIAPEQQMLIFEAFQQANGTTSRKYGGTGLGLSISRELAKLLAGEICMQSTPGVGTTFTLYLPESLDGAKQALPPAISNEAPVPESLPAPEVYERPVPEEARRFKLSPVIPDDRMNLEEGDRVLLIIEDDPFFAKILYNFARKKGFKCLVAGDGETGLQLAVNYKPSALTLDIQLPGLSGWEVLSALKDNPDTRHIPVHFISVDEKSLDAYKLGAIGFITKPVSPEELDEVFKGIEEVIARKIKILLLVEDDQVTRKCLRGLIEGTDITIVEAATGEAAWELIQSRRFDCMILDLSLPDISGFELLDRLKGHESIPKFPIIIYTGKELSRTESQQLMKYADSVIVKGVKSQERLVDETALFLHRVVADMPEKKRRMIKSLHDRDAILEGKKILIVDDDMRNSFALSKLLTDRGMEVEIAEDGRTALEMLDKQPHFDLILMDIMMPIMDGFETTRRIKAQEKFRSLPVLALTAKAMKGDREKCIAAGANDYLSKPVDIDRLFSMLRVWLYR